MMLAMFKMFCHTAWITAEGDGLPVVCAKIVHLMLSEINPVIESTMEANKFSPGQTIKAKMPACCLQLLSIWLSSVLVSGSVSKLNLTGVLASPPAALPPSGF